MNNSPVLYILMRKDLSSMNAGKAMAQASHASNAFVKEVSASHQNDIPAFKEWANSTPQGFGTVLVLAVNGAELQTVVASGKGEGLVSNLVIDPTYPYKTTAELASLIPVSVDTSERIVNGDQATLFRKEVTCGYIFGYKDNPDLRAIVSGFPLHP